MFAFKEGQCVHQMKSDRTKNEKADLKECYIQILYFL